MDPTAAGNTLSAEQILGLIDVGRIPIAITLLVVGWVAMAFLSRMLDNLADRFTERRLTLMKGKALFRFFVYVVLGFIVPVSLLNAAGRQAMLPLLATLGLGLGFAFRDLVASLIAGVTLLVDEPFQVGDRIQFGGYYGEVKVIGLRSVRLATLDDNLVTVPNSKFLTDPVASGNAGELDMMIVVPFHVGLDEDIETARRTLEEVAATSSFIYLDKPIVTVVEETQAGEHFAMRIALKCYVFDTRYEKALFTDLTVRGRQALNDAGMRAPDQVPWPVRVESS